MSDETTNDTELMMRFQIARRSMEAARIALDVPEACEAVIELDSLISDVNEAIDFLLSTGPHSHEFGEWEDDPAGVVRHCACGAIDFRPEG